MREQRDLRWQHDCELAPRFTQEGEPHDPVRIVVAACELASQFFARLDFLVALPARFDQLQAIETQAGEMKASFGSTCCERVVLAFYEMVAVVPLRAWIENALAC